MINRSIKVDDDGNWVVEGGLLVWVDGEDYIIQTLKENMRLFLGEYRYDTSVGMPWFQQILVKGYNPNVARGAFINCALNSPGISSVRNLTLSFDRPNRTLNVNIEAQSDLGLLVTSFTLPTGV